MLVLDPTTHDIVSAPGSTATAPGPKATAPGSTATAPGSTVPRAGVLLGALLAARSGRGD